MPQNSIGTAIASIRTSTLATEDGCLYLGLKSTAGCTLGTSDLISSSTLFALALK
jgi:hypothetical protein